MQESETKDRKLKKKEAGLDCVYVAMVDVNVCVDTITGNLQEKNQCHNLK